MTSAKSPKPTLDDAERRTGRSERIPTPLEAVAVSEVSLSELLSALSHALDLTEGSPPCHTMRSCVIGMRMAEELALPADARGALYHALLLKDSGCSSNAARVTTLFGTDDRQVKQRMKTLRDTSLVSRLRAMMALTAPHARWWTRMAYLMGMPRPSVVEQELMRIRCDRGSAIARGLGFPEATAQAIAALDERWDGSGYPHHLAGHLIPLLARIAAIAQTFDLFLQAEGLVAARDMLRSRRGTWFEPRLCDLVLAWRADDVIWTQLVTSEVAKVVRALTPPDTQRPVSEDDLDMVCLAFAEIIDAKTPFTFRHSEQVSYYATRVASHFTSDVGDLRRIRRAGLLHDIGKLGVSNAILDKAGPLTTEERTAMQLHPQHTWDILSGIGAFRDFAMLAAVHHEKLDGSGYPWGLGADELGSLERILVVADMYEALTADRPYRRGLSRDAALGILSQEAGGRLWPAAIEALAVVTGDDDRPTTA